MIQKIEAALSAEIERVGLFLRCGQGAVAVGQRVFGAFCQRRNRFWGLWEMDNSASL